jgi:Flp pilus assembly protein TadG
MKRQVGAAGQPACEFALVLPILLLLMTGRFEGGRAPYNSNVLATAAREGATAGTTYSSTNDATVRRTVPAHAVVLSGLADSDIVILPGGSRSAGRAITLASSATMRVE